MTRPHTTSNEYMVETRLPLPGLYPVVTWQLNLTLHKATGLAKFVSIIREPSDHVELIRVHRELDGWPLVHQQAIETCQDAIVSMGQLMGMPTAIFGRNA